jgi:predicted amidohydrolase
MSVQVHLAVAHFPGSIGEPGKNLVFVERLARAAAKDSAEFLLLPENCLTGYPGDENSAAKVALSRDSAELKRVTELAHGYGIAIAAGFIETLDKTFHSTHLLAWPDGTRSMVRKRSVDARDSKIGLTAAREENPDFKIAGVRAALAICMDGNEAFFAGAKDRGARIILHPSGGACAATARAKDSDANAINAAEIENCRRCLESARNRAKQLTAAYCVANTIGFDGERGYPGNSYIISPSGDVLVHLKGTAIVEEMREAVGVAAITFPT